MHPNETGRAEARNVAIGKNQKKCSSCNKPSPVRTVLSFSLEGYPVINTLHYCRFFKTTDKCSSFSVLKIISF